jgi:hypothetical protein
MRLRMSLRRCGWCGEELGMDRRFFVELDLGQEHDYSALTVVEIMGLLGSGTRRCLRTGRLWRCGCGTWNGYG